MKNNNPENEYVDYEDCDINLEQNKLNDNTVEIKNGEEPNFIPRNWFEKLFGFTETIDFNFNRENMQKLYIQNNNSYCIKDIPTGIFSIHKNTDLHQLFKSPHKKIAHPVVTIENIVGDINTIYHNADLRHNSIFQVETLSNFLGNNTKTITNYENGDFSHLLLNPSGLAYRNYINPSQHNMFYNFFNYVETINPNISHAIKDGHLYFENANEIKKVNKILAYDIQRRREIRLRIISGLHKNQGLVIDGILQQHTVTQILNCGIPINKNNFDPDLWKGIVELYLEGLYENALLLAHQHNLEKKSIGTCYLTPIGENMGVDKNQIVRAIQRACHIMSLKGIKLNIKLIHKNNIANEYTHLPKQYPLNEVFVNSIWDNNNWVNNSVQQ